MFIKIDRSNAAFEYEGELNRILNTVTGESDQKLRDINGNVVGFVSSINVAEIDVAAILEKTRTIIGNEKFLKEFGYFAKKYDI